MMQKAFLLLIGWIIPMVLCNAVRDDKSDIPSGLESQQGHLWTFSERSIETSSQYKHTAFDRMHRVPASLHNVKYIEPSKLGRAVRLDGEHQWIAIDAVIDDCFAFDSQTCIGKDVTISFWIRMRNGRRILGTGGYTMNEAGPGIRLEWDEKTEIMNVEFSDGEHMWKVNIILKKDKWTNVFAVWSKQNGLRVTLDGHIMDGDLHKIDEKGTPHKINETTKYSNILTIGLPANMTKIEEYGQLDLAHLQLYTYEPPTLRIRKLPSHMLRKVDDNNCCSKKKVYNGCLEKPCGNKKCLEIETEFTDCICPKVQVKKCTVKNAFTSNPSTATFITTPEPCAQYRGAYKLQGCRNEYKKKDTPTCYNKVCYYGKCVATYIEHCECPVCDQKGKKLGGMVCGSNHQTYESYCVMTKDSCEKKKVIKMLHNGACIINALDKALHYWSFKTVEDKGASNKKSKISEDEINKQEAKLQNGVEEQQHDQLGTVLKFSGKQHMIVNKIANPCITNVTCKNGITASFWMKYIEGDLIFATGGFHGTNGNGPGFQFKRNKETKLFELRLLNNQHQWTLPLYNLPRNWFHFAFTWQQESGVKIYINGKEKRSQANYDDAILEQNTIEKRQSIQPKLTMFHKDLYNELSFAKENNLMRGEASMGIFELAHVALWNSTLKEDEIHSIYKGEILKTEKQQRCCMKKHKPNPNDKNAEECGYNPEDESERCICPEIDNEYEERCKPLIQQSNWYCHDTNPRCQILKQTMDGFCHNFDIEARSDCAATCSKCTPKILALMNPQKHFSQETLIFALLGCIGGLILLFGTMFYFWKVYRTRYHGRFVPPMKDGASTADGQEYDDEKWTTRYVDSSEYFIKDVPHKKRALPLIPAKNSQVNHRYQPPEFD